MGEWVIIIIIITMFFSDNNEQCIAIYQVSGSNIRFLSVYN